MLAVSCGFAGPILKLVGAESGGIHFHDRLHRENHRSVVAVQCVARWQRRFCADVANHINGPRGYRGSAPNDEPCSWMSWPGDPEMRRDGVSVGEGQGKARMTRSIAVRKEIQWALLLSPLGN